MKRTQLAQGVYQNEFDAEKFKSCRVSLSFVWPATRERATAEALMALVMERGYAACPDMTELSKKLAALYGASLSVDMAMLGANRVLTVAVTGLRDAYALQGEALSAAYAEIAAGVAFTPYLPGGQFDGQAVEIEREQLRERLEREKNEKRVYCIRQARRRFFGDSPEGIERWGYLDELDRCTGADLTAAFDAMLRTARIEVMVLGADGAQVAQTVTEALADVSRAPAELAPPCAMPHTAVQAVDEPMETVQGKLCLLFTAGAPVEDAAVSIMRVATALLGGTATSRLFTRVREQQSLCYYCSASGVARSGLLCIDSGVEHANAAAARAAILHEVDELCHGDITEKELEDTKRAILTALHSVGDALAGLESWYFGEIMRGTPLSPAQAIEQVQQVTAQQVRKMLSRFTLSVVYTITEEGKAQ